MGGDGKASEIIADWICRVHFRIKKLLSANVNCFFCLKQKVSVVVQKVTWKNRCWSGEGMHVEKMSLRVKHSDNRQRIVHYYDKKGRVCKSVLPRLKDSPILEDWSTQSRSTEFSQSKECVRFSRFLNREAHIVSITVCSKLCVVQFGTL